jgi:hypothetical protein
MPCCAYVSSTFRGTIDQANENPGACFRCTAEIFLNITYREILWPGLLISRQIYQVSILGYTNDWHNRRSWRKLIMCIPPPIACVHLAAVSTTLRVRKAHLFKIEVRMKRIMG